MSISIRGSMLLVGGGIEKCLKWGEDLDSLVEGMKERHFDSWVLILLILFY